MQDLGSGLRLIRVHNVLETLLALALRVSWGLYQFKGFGLATLGLHTWVCGPFSRTLGGLVRTRAISGPYEGNTLSLNPKP